MTGIPKDELKLVLLSLSGGPPSHRVLQAMILLVFNDVAKANNDELQYKY